MVPVVDGALLTMMLCVSACREKALTLFNGSPTAKQQEKAQLYSGNCSSGTRLVRSRAPCPKTSWKCAISNRV